MHKKNSLFIHFHEDRKTTNEKEVQLKSLYGCCGLVCVPRFRASINTFGIDRTYVRVSVCPLQTVYVCICERERFVIHT